MVVADANAYGRMTAYIALCYATMAKGDVFVGVAFHEKLAFNLECHLRQEERTRLSQRAAAVGRR